MAAYYLHEALSQLILLTKDKIEAEEKFLKSIVTTTVEKQTREKREQRLRYIGFKEGRVHAMKQILKALQAFKDEGDFEKTFTEWTSLLQTS